MKNPLKRVTPSNPNAAGKKINATFMPIQVSGLQSMGARSVRWSAGSADTRE